MADDWKKGYHLAQLLHYDADSYTLEFIIERVVSVLAQHPFIISSCPRIESDDTVDLTCPYYIQAPIFRDCSLIANFFGPFTVEEIATMMNEDPRKVHKLISSGMKKLKKQMEKEEYV